MTANKLTVLFDLDDTLLSNDMDVFLPFYMTALSKHMDVAPVEQLAPILMAGTKQMMIKTLPAGTLEETFDETFYPGLGIAKETVRERVDEFYRFGFNQLENHTALRPQARPVMEHCFAKGYQTVIATNPLMPLQANLNRLRWANVSAEDFSYKLITSYETSHFCKPHPAYFAEILGRLGWKQNPVVMVGNSRDDDIIPAMQLGIPTFWLVTENAKPPVSEIPKYCTTGQMGHIPAWLDNIAANQIVPTEPAPEGMFAVIQSTPAVLASFVQVVSSSQKEMLNGLHDFIETEINKNFPEIIAVCGTTPSSQEIKSRKLDGSLSETLDHFMSLRTNLLKQILPHRKNWSAGSDDSKWIACLHRMMQSDQEAIRRLYPLVES